MVIAIAILLFAHALIGLVAFYAQARDRDLPLAMVALIGSALFIFAGVVELVALSAFVIPIGILLCLSTCVMFFFGEEGFHHTDERLPDLIVAGLVNGVAGVYQLVALT